MKLRLLVLAVLLSVFSVNAQELLPKSKGFISKKSYYTISYNEKHEQPNWVYYELKPQFIKAKTKRSNKFKADKSIPSGSATLKDYKASGYDRGHLCPAAAMKLNAKAMSESFFMSNMSPQAPQFNRGVWKKLEAKVRKWVLSERRLYVVSGPIFKNNLGTIGANKVTIPGSYYKVIYDPTDTKKMIAFILPNKASSAKLSSFVVSVDKVEQAAGIDFFPALPDSIENKLEAKSNVRRWTFSK